jgi:putative ABC transport system substrate-binding protein
MRRRGLVASFGGTMLALTARAQQRPVMPVIGYLGFTSPEQSIAGALDAFVHSLKEGGYVDSRNVTIEYRWPRGDPGLLPAYASELVALKVAVIVAPAINAALVARNATHTIPIVFVAARPIENGLVASYNRPGGNATGVDIFLGDLLPKRLELVRDLLPAAVSVAYLLNPDGPNTANERTLAEAASRATGLELQLVEARTGGEMVLAFERFVARRPDVVITGTHPLFFAQRQQIIALAARHAIPVIYEWPGVAAEGGLIGLGPSLTEAISIVGNYTARILSGAKPGELPVQRLSKLALSINLKTARALGLRVPPPLLARADEVIE